MNIVINGEQKSIEPRQTVGELVGSLGTAAGPIAVELNRQVVRKRDWDSVLLEEDDRVEIIHFVGGG
jgi:thiamine biosynthesis protein ThiS